MAISLSMIDLSRTDPAATVQVADQARLNGQPAVPSPTAAPSGPRAARFAGAAVSLAQVALVGRAMIDGAALPGSLPERSDVAPGEPRQAERVLAPWGVPMLPSEAARLAREASEAERQAVLRSDATPEGQRVAAGGVTLPGAALEADRTAGTDGRSPDVGRRRASILAASGSPAVAEEGGGASSVQSGSGAFSQAGSPPASRSA